MDIHTRILKELESKEVINRETKPVGNILAEWMNKKELSVNTLTRRSGVSQSQISYILRNITKHPKMETMIALCIGLGLTYEESKSFLADTGYDDFENENRFNIAIVLYTMILKVPGIDIVRANIILILGMHELIKRGNNMSWMPSLIPSYITAADRIYRKYPQTLPFTSQKELMQNMYHGTELIYDSITKFECIENELENTNEKPIGR